MLKGDKIVINIDIIDQLNKIEVSGCHIIPPLEGNFVPKFKSKATNHGFGKRWGYFCFIKSSCSQVNLGPRLAFQRTFTIGMRLRFVRLTS